MAANINRVVLVGNLTRDPELRHTPSVILSTRVISASVSGGALKRRRW